MAHPADIAPKAPAAFASGRLSPEEAERLASTFRPSWELDDAPFTGPGTLSEGDLRALQGGGTHADVRAVAQASPGASVSHASNGSHAPPPPTQSHEPENSVIIDRSITADVPKPVAATRPGATMLGMAPPPAVQAAVQAVAPPPPPQPAPEAPPPAPARPPPAPISRRPPAPAFHVPPPAPVRAKPVSIDFEEGYPKKSRTGLWAGLGVGGVVVIGLAVWLVASSGSPEKAATTAPTATKTADDKISAIPPPPPATTAAATVDPLPPATTVAAAPPPAPAPIPTTPVTALPQAPPHVAAAQPRTYGGGAAPAPRPAPKPKGGQTIVRDVPF